MPIWTIRILILMCGGFAHMLSPSSALSQDLERGEELFEVCAACHGNRGQGGGGGIYPRLAGLRSAYVASQLRAFKTRERLNIPMLMFSDDRQLPEGDILDLAAYLDSLELVTRAIPAAGTARSGSSKPGAVEIPRAPGNVETGEARYRVECARCHRLDGWGDDQTPALAGQHTRYLASRIAGFRSSEHAHTEAHSLFTNRPDSEFVDILAFLSILEETGPASISAKSKEGQP